MMQLNQYLLEFSKAIAYFQYNLDGTNTLSSAVCKYVQFEKGTFYTILRANLSEEQLYGFRWGGIGGSSREKVVNILLKKSLGNPKVHLIFDDVDATYSPSYEWSLFSDFGVHYDEEVYYIISGQGVSKDLLNQGLNATAAIWHALCVLSDVDFSRGTDQSIKESEIVNFAKGAQMIVVGAYDGEGYVCWEKNNP